MNRRQSLIKRKGGFPPLFYLVLPHRDNLPKTPSKPPQTTEITVTVGISPLAASSLSSLYLNKVWNIGENLFNCVELHDSPTAGTVCDLKLEPKVRVKLRSPDHSHGNITLPVLGQGKLMYDRSAQQAQDSPFKEFDNSFSLPKTQASCKLQCNADKKWSSVGEGFSHQAGKVTGANSSQKTGSRSENKNAKSTKRKLSDTSFAKFSKNSSKYATEEETDELSADINCLSSDDSESEKTPCIKELSKGSNSRIKRPRCPDTSTSKCAQKSVYPATEDVIIEFDVDQQPSAGTEGTDSESAEPADCIADYDSDNEDINAVSSSPADLHSEGTCEDISTQSSVSKSASPKVSPSQVGGKIKAGDWLKNIHWQGGSPTKSSSQSEVANLEDSAKKKKKYSKCSMADQLSRLQSREKSAQTVWYHKMREAQSGTVNRGQDCSKSVTVRVTSVQICCSVCVTTCTQLTNGEMSGTTKLPAVSVMFSQNSANSQTIKLGAVVRIYPPWQTLDIPSLGHNVLSCSYYSAIPGPRDPHKLTCEDSTACDTNTVTSFTAFWRCPCAQDERNRADSCPAYSISNLCLTSLSSITQPRPNTGEGDTAQSTSCNLHTVLDSQTPGGHMSESILDSIENTGHSTTIGLSFQAVVRRVFCKRHLRPSYLSWSILVEDSHGVFAVIQLPDHSNHLDNWKDVLSGEGLNIRLTGVTLLRRTNRDRDPSLFSVLDCVWRQNTHAVLECSTDDSYSESTSRPCPGFCYLIKAWQERSGAKLSHNASVSSDLRPEIKSHSLKIVRSSAGCQADSDERWSFMCRVVYVDDLSQSDVRPCNNCCQIVYVADQSLLSTPTSPSPIQLLYVMETCELTDISLDQSCVLFVKDSHLHNGKLICDEYSRVVKLSPPDQRSNFPLIPEELHSECEVLRTQSIKPPSLNTDSVVGDLVTVEGKVITVNEEECYIWPECDRCGNEHLTSDPNTSVLSCPACQCPVLSPVNRIKMEVCVQCPELYTGQSQVQLQLLQTTVERLLPASQSEEGYDVSCVLNVPIGPLSCIVLEIVSNLQDGGVCAKLQEVKLL